MINANERIDEIGFGSLRVIQDPEAFCYGIDAVLLADFAAKQGERRKAPGQTRGHAADLGTGTGIVPLILSHKTSISFFLGIELQEEACRRAERTAALNGLADRIRIMKGDVSRPETFSGLEERFDLVTANPPYLPAGGGLTGKGSARTLSRHESSGTLKDFIAAAARLLRDKGDFYLIHRPGRLADICTVCREHRLEPKGLQMVSPRSEEPPNLLLFHGVKNARPEIKMLPPLFVYQDREYTPGILKIYERGSGAPEGAGNKR